MLEIRASKVPLAVLCAQSLTPARTPIASQDDAARLGSAMHAVLASRVKLGYVSDDVDHAAATWNVDRDELAPLVGWAWHTWQEHLSPMFPNPNVEMELWASEGGASGSDDTKLTGHPDLFALVYPDGFGIDYKSGYLDFNATEQCKAYAWLLFRNFEELETVRWSVVRVREQRADTFLWTRAEIEHWFSWLAAHLRTTDYRPGPHCQYCPRALECDARTASLRSGLEWMLGQDADLSNFTPERLARLVLTCRHLERMIGGIMIAAKTEVQLRGGSIQGERASLEIVEQRRRSIDVARGYDALVSAIGHETLLSLCKVSKGDVEMAIKATAPQGQRGYVVKEFLDRLESIGALTVSVVSRLEVSTAAKELTGKAE